MLGKKTPLLLPLSQAAEQKQEATAAELRLSVAKDLPEVFPNMGMEKVVMPVATQHNPETRAGFSTAAFASFFPPCTPLALASCLKRMIVLCLEPPDLTDLT